MYFRWYGLRKMWLDKCLKSSGSEDPSTSNMVSGPKHCWNLYDNTLLQLIITVKEIESDKVFLSDM